MSIGFQLLTWFVFWKRCFTAYAQQLTKTNYWTTFQLHNLKFDNLSTIKCEMGLSMLNAPDNEIDFFLKIKLDKILTTPQTASNKLGTLNSKLVCPCKNSVRHMRTATKCNYNYIDFDKIYGLILLTKFYCICFTASISLSNPVENFLLHLIIYFIVLIS